MGLLSQPYSFIEENDSELYKVLLSEVSREEEFAPVKNKNAEGAVDSPDTARDLISKLH